MRRDIQKYDGTITAGSDGETSTLHTSIGSVSANVR